jgi:hypothetical protein
LIYVLAAFFAATFALAAGLGVLVVGHVTKAWETERKEWTRERQILLNRIKPETAQPVGDEPTTVLPAVGWDDDDDFYAAQAGMSKEELADRAFADEIAS